MRRVVRFRMPSHVMSRDGDYWTAVIDGERVRAPYVAGEYAKLVTRIKEARKARAKAAKKS